MLQNKVSFEGLRAVGKQDSPDDLLASPEKGPGAIYWGKWFVWTGVLFIFVFYLLTSSPPSAQRPGRDVFEARGAWARKSLQRGLSRHSPSSEIKPQFLEEGGKKIKGKGVKKCWGGFFIAEVYGEGRRCGKIRARNPRRAAGGELCGVGLG